MNPDRSVDDIFLEAIEIADEAQQREFLREACASSPELLPELFALLEASRRTSILDKRLKEVEVLASLAKGQKPSVQIGPFRIVDVIGHGGMGSVFLAEQSSPVTRKVALKLIRIDRQSAEATWRFQLEQNALARLEHPNIARVIEASCDSDELSYFAMEYVPGCHITKYCSENIDLATRLELFQQCCLAIQHAHLRAIVHRDIKPSNVLVATVDDRPLVKVIDFGIAKLLEHDHSMSGLHGPMTMPGVGMGTPAYMSPEQLRGDPLIDTRSDVYSLGALLYSILTGKPPYDFSDTAVWTYQKITKVISDELPAPPSVILEQNPRNSQRSHQASNALPASSLKGDLDCIVLKAMAREPARRYQSVAELLDDIHRYQQHRPISAQHDSLLYRASRFIRRRRISLISGFIALLGIGIMLLQANRAIRSERQLAKQSYATDLLLASFALQNEDSFEASRALKRQAPEDGQRDERSFDWKILATLCERPSSEFFSANGSIYFLCRLPGRNEIVSCGEEGLIRFHSVEDGRIRLTIQAGQGEVNGVAANRYGSRLASAGDDGTIAVWDTNNGQKLGTFQAHKRQAFQVAWSSDDEWLATCGNENDVQLWSAKTFQHLSTLSSKGRDLECVGISPQNSLAFGAEAGTLVLMMPDPETGLPTERRDQQATWYGGVPAGQCSTVAFSPAGGLLAAGRESGSLVLQQPSEADGFYREFPMNEAVWSLSFSPDGELLAAGEKDGSISVIELSALTRSSRLVLSPELTNNKGEPATLSSSESHQGPRLVRSRPTCRDGILPAGVTSIRLEFSEPLVNADVTDHYTMEIRSVAAGSAPTLQVSPESVEVDGSVVTLNFASMATSGQRDGNSTPVSTWQAHDNSITAICYSQAGNWLVSADKTGRLRKFPVRRNTAVRQIASDVLSMTQLATSLIAMTDNDGTIRIRRGNPDTDRENTADSMHNLPLSWKLKPGEMVVGTSGRTMYVADGDEATSSRGIALLDIETEKLSHLWKPPTGEFVRTLVGPCDDHRLVVELTPAEESPQKSSNARFVVLDLSTLAETTSFDLRMTYGKILSPDGRWMLAQSGEGLHLVDLNSGQVRSVFSSPKATITGFAFSPNCEEAVVSFADRMIRLVDVTTGAVTQEFSSQGCAATAIAWTPDGLTLATVGVDGYLRCWKRDLLQLTMALKLPTRNLTQIAFDSTGNKALVLDRNGRLFELVADFD